MLQEMPDVNLDDLSDEVTPGQASEFAGLRMQIRKEDQQEVEDAAASDWGDPEAPTPQAQRIGALFLHLWRTYGQ
jgi:hypothetical protein